MWDSAERRGFGEAERDGMEGCARSRQAQPQMVEFVEGEADDGETGGEEAITIDQ